MSVSIIYDVKGLAEYAVVPIKTWQKLSHFLNSDEIEKSVTNHKNFNPQDFRGLLNQSNLDLESEISNLRNEWIRNI